MGIKVPVTNLLSKPMFPSFKRFLLVNLSINYTYQNELRYRTVSHQGCVPYGMVYCIIIELAVEKISLTSYTIVLAIKTPKLGYLY